MELEGWETFSSPCTRVSAETTQKTFGLADLMSMYSVCTRRVFGGIRHRSQTLRSGVPLQQEVPATAHQNLWLLHDGEPVHFSKVVRNHGHATYPGRWIGRG
ncbi:hypothetical protein TNCV_2490361 [Trichonephila clavipes]|nr:hypothetical protein TNCV_2490361 [Trichonephila clavipes]